MPDPLQHACRQLRLCGMAASLELRHHEAASHGIPHRQFLELLFQDELNVRSHRSLERRKKLAQFPDLQPLETFDWQFNPQINRAQIFQFATAQFVRERRDVLLLGPPGLGKSHIAQAIGYADLRADFQVLCCSVLELVRKQGVEIVRMQGRSYRLRNAAMMAGACKMADEPKTPTETGAGNLGRSLGGPPRWDPSRTPQDAIADRCASSHDGSTPIGDPSSSPKNRAGKAPERGAENH